MALREAGCLREKALNGLTLIRREGAGQCVKFRVKRRQSLAGTCWDRPGGSKQHPPAVAGVGQPRHKSGVRETLSERGCAAGGKLQALGDLAGRQLALTHEMLKRKDVGFAQADEFPERDPPTNARRRVALKKGASQTVGMVGGHEERGRSRLGRSGLEPSDRPLTPGAR